MGSLDFSKTRRKLFYSMQATLIIPSEEGITQLYPLSLEFENGKPLLRSSHGHVVHGSYFQLLRDRMGARIETSDREIVARVLGLPLDEPGLVAA